MLALTVSLLLTAAPPPDPFKLAVAKDWSALGKALDGKKVPPMKPETASYYTAARRMACEASQDAIAQKLASLGATGDLFCLAAAGKWDELTARVSTSAPMDDGPAQTEDISGIIERALATDRTSLVLMLATKFAPSRCEQTIFSTLNARKVALAKDLMKACPAAAKSIGSWLGLVCRSQGIDQLRAWREAGIDLNQPLDGSTCLHFAALRGDEAMTRLLLDNGADVAAIARDAPTYSFQATPDALKSVAGYAVAGGSVGVVKALLEKGADFKPMLPIADRAYFFPGAALPHSTDSSIRKDPSLTRDTERTRLRTILSLLHGEQPAVLVVGGGATREAAEQSLEAWKLIAPHVDTFFKVPAGFPRIVESDSIAGLKPGFHVVLLAAASEFELTPYLPIINALRTGCYVRPVSWKPEVPAPLTLTGDFDRHTTVSRKVKKSMLSVTALWTGGVFKFVGTLYDPTGKLVHVEAGQDDFGRCSDACTPLEFEEDGAGFSVSGVGEFPACTTPDVRESVLRVFVKGDQVVSKGSSKLISKGQCD